MQCKDILTKELKIDRLYTFSKGRDGGIDITDDVIKKNIVIQVKHYINSSYSSLYSSLKQEVDKVKKLKPGKYYLCIAQNLTPENKAEIRRLFGTYMPSDNMIYSLQEIDDFLNKDENNEVLKKHYKLWLDSTNVLNIIYNNNILIDCDTLMYDIIEQQKLFVETSYYKKCIEELEKKRIVMLIGLPGVGKTMTTKMLALYYVSKGYKIRYTTDGSVSNLKKAISQSEEEKELIILDDCLGQIYFKMKEFQERELVALIKYISIHKNKKLIMNSRIAIFNEAKNRSDELENICSKKVVALVNMDGLTTVEKGWIFYNHLYFSELKQEYYNNIIYNNSYRRIVRHMNYTPRIMEYVTNLHNIQQIEPEHYAEYVVTCLNNPLQIWDNEFKTRLSEIDRIFMMTLYSLTETSIEEYIFKRAFNKILEQRNDIDKTIDLFEESLKRLLKSMVIKYDKKDAPCISVINPSVNDYLKNYVHKNQLFCNFLKENCSEHIQIKRLFPSEFSKMVESGEAMKLNYSSENIKKAEILTCICMNKILSNKCRKMVADFINDLDPIYYGDMYSRIRIICELLTEPFNSYYSVLQNLDLIQLYRLMDLYDFREFIKYSIKYGIFCINDTTKDLFINNLNRAIKEYCENDIESDSYMSNYDFDAIKDECIEEVEVVIDTNDGPYMDIEHRIDVSNIEDTVQQWIKDDVEKEIIDDVSTLPEDYRNEVDIDVEMMNIDMSPLEGYIMSYFEPGDYYDDDYRDMYIDESEDALDGIFKG